MLTVLFLCCRLLVPNVDHVHDIAEACESVVDLPPPARTTSES